MSDTPTDNSYDEYWQFGNKLHEQWMESGSKDSFTSWLIETIQQRNGLIEALSQRNTALVDALGQLRNIVAAANAGDVSKDWLLLFLENALSETKEDGNE